MLDLIPVFWVFLVLGPVGVIDDGLDGKQIREGSPSSSVPKTGKPIKIPAKKVAR